MSLKYLNRILILTLSLTLSFIPVNAQDKAQDKAEDANKSETQTKAETKRRRGKTEEAGKNDPDQGSDKKVDDTVSRSTAFFAKGISSNKDSLQFGSKERLDFPGLKFKRPKSGSFDRIADSSNAPQGGNDADIAKQLSNPVASLISVPFQVNYDRGFGPNGDGAVWRTNIQPVIPISLNDDWNLISRTIVPIVFQNDVPVAGSGENGLGDIVQSFFFSPAKPTSSGIVWGAGPVILLPTATDAALGNEKWGIGPTIVVLKQQGQWTFGSLGNHIWSFAGDSSRADVSATFIQPFVSYITKSKTTYSFNTESTYDWERKNWAVPLNFTASQLLKAGDQLFQIGAGPRVWVNSPTGGPDWGLRFQFVLLFPKK